MDDFEICCPVKSKAGKHKICGIYFQIRNLPPNLSAKIDNIFLVALATSSDLKDDRVLNDLNELIFDDLAKLESVGFETTQSKSYKAALVNVACDNLGANIVLGFSKGFHANYYCRVCTMHRTECEFAVKENTGKLRSTLSHQENIDFRQDNPAAKLTDTEGVRMDCLYNKLENFDMFDNVSLDVMHDIHEGIIPSFLEVFFDYIIRHKIATEDEIISKIRDYNYGPLFEKKKPSLLSFKKVHLGQNANQAYCIILHLPYIFYYLRDKLSKIWPTLQDLLQCVQIIMSVKVTDMDLKRFEDLIESYLNGILKLKTKLTPKEHFLTHYPNAFRKVGPLKLLWTMRFECKHKYFTDAAKLTYNFININKTLAFKHQEQISLKKYSIQNDIEQSKKPILFRKHCDFTKYESFLTTVDKNIDFDEFFMLPFLNFNSYTYRSGLLLIENFLVYNILFVFKSHNNKYHFLCELYETKVFNHSLNSIEIQPDTQQLAYLNHSDLSNLQTFSKIICNEKIYIIAENLSVFNPSNEI